MGFETMYHRAAITLSALAVLAQPSLPAEAQTIDFDHVIAVAGSQATASQMMAKDALLIALDVDRQARLEELEYWHDQFDRTLTGLRDGDEILGLPAAQTPAIANGLETAGSLWESTKGAMLDGIAAGDITPDQITVQALDLTTVFEGIAGQYAEEANRNRLTSMLVNALLESLHGSMLSQRMATEFLLVVYGHEVEANRAGLSRSITGFDQVLDNLVNGNLERRMLPPPNDDLRDRLLRIRRIWEDEFRPIMRRGLDAGRPSPSVALQMAEVNGQLLEQMKAVTSIYVGL